MPTSPIRRKSKKAMSTPLHTLLVNHIRNNGPVGVAEFMAQCLYHPQHGYYTRGLNFSTTPARDFITAPELTPLFGAVLANWVAKAWQAAKSPNRFILAEGGPGRGTLMHDVLTHLQTAHPECFAAAQPLLVETSPALATLQQQTLADFRQCRWAGELPPPPSLPLVVLANELLDAFPAEQYSNHRLAWHRHVVEVDQTGELAFATRPLPAEETPLLPPHWQPAEGAQLETSPAQTAFLAHLKQTATAALLLDYGYRQLPPTGGHTLQGLYRHQKVGPLHMPGETDLTTHVNFAQTVQTLGVEAAQVEDLAPFLLRHGLIELGLQHPSQQSALQRLLHPAQMGSLFKVVEFTRSA